MKRIILLFILVSFGINAMAQDMEKIKLNTPDMKRGLSTMEALSKRQSTREYADKSLSLQDLSDLIWAAAGINREDQGKRTSPTATNAQEIDLYVCFPEGVYRYMPKEHSLEPVAKGDFRSTAASQQEFAAKAPVILIIVADISKFRGDNKEDNLLYGAMDAGIVSQNISLFCAANDLATVPRGWMMKEELHKALKLTETQYLMLNHPVGYMK